MLIINGLELILIFVVESWEQVQNDSCGYFALQNATNLVMAAMVENEAESERYLKNILSPASFWVNHSKYKYGSALLQCSIVLT